MKNIQIIIYIGCFLFFCCSCSQITGFVFGVSQPKVEKLSNCIDFIREKGISDKTLFSPPTEIEKVFLRGNFPIIYVLNNKGQQIHKPDCYQVVSKVMYELADSVGIAVSDSLLGQTLNAIGFTDEKQQPVTINFAENDYTVLFYWSIWLGTYNSKKLVEAQTAIQAINQEGKVKIKLQPINFDFLEEWYWTDAQYDAFWEQVKEKSNSK